VRVPFQEQKIMQEKLKEHARVVAQSMQSLLVPIPEKIEWLLSQLPLKVLDMALLFRGSTHGCRAAKFHSLCDNKGPTITFIKS
jgi:hypothetical protein